MGELLDLVEKAANPDKPQYVSITLEQYTNWLLKAHTINQIQKLYDEIDDYECFTEAVGALIKN